MSVLVGRPAPDFTAAAILGTGEISGNFNLHQAITNKYGLVFFYPLDFTFVCPTELIALDKKIGEFQKRNFEVIGISIDSHFAHAAWRNLSREEGGIGPVHYTLVADITHKICQDYGVEHPDANVAMRAAFLIDKQGIVQAQLVNNLPLGRSISELIRLADAMQHHEKHGEVCPANWETGKTSMKPTSAGVAAYLTSHTEEL